MRFVVLVLLNLPIILLALLNVITQLKMRRIGKERFRNQLITWLVILVILVTSFPVYNLLVGRPILDAHSLSTFDMVEITMIILLIYIINHLRQKIERTEHLLRELHRKLSIKLSDK